MSFVQRVGAACFKSSLDILADQRAVSPRHQPQVKLVPVPGVWTAAWVEVAPADTHLIIS